ncbi:MAG TPA: signal peptidase I [Candidatus Limnocylindrales bacterium]|nr:signal peptidase I [Candidatus Limnocylindrales bacterium]
MRSNSGNRSVLWLQKFAQALAIVCLSIVCYFLISHFVVQSVRVVGESMHPTLENSQQYLLNHWVFYFRHPHRSEIVVIRDPTDRGLSVKRVIGLGGEQIFFKHGAVFINGKQLAEPYLQPGTLTFAGAYRHDQVFQCGNDEVFVLGDNRNNSLDGRAYGPIPRQSVLGLIVR